MRVLVTGPFGTIGRHVVRALREAGHTVVGLDLDTPRNRAEAAAWPSGSTVVYGDVTRADDVARAAAGVDAVVHLAAIIPPASDAQPERARHVNVEGTRVVLETMRTHCPAARLVFPSSVSVHGPSAGRTPPVRIDTACMAMDAYAGHKIECEALVRASGLRAVVLRIGACADPGDLDKGGDAATMLRTTFGIAAQTRIEYLHPLDAAHAIARACDHPDVDGKVLFLGSGRDSQLTWARFVSTFPEALGLGPFPDAWFGDSPYYTDWMDTEESERLLHYQVHGYPAYRAAIEARTRWLRWLLVPFRPLVRALMARKVEALRDPR